MCQLKWIAIATILLLCLPSNNALGIPSNADTNQDGMGLDPQFYFMITKAGDSSGTPVSCIAVGETLYLRAWVEGLDWEHFNADVVIFEGENLIAEAENAAGTNETQTTTGLHHFTAAADVYNDNDDVVAYLGPIDKYVTVVGIASIVIDGTTDSGPAYVAAGTVLKLRAIPVGGPSFPDGWPTWELDRDMPYSSSGPLMSIVPDEGMYHVYATCGSSSAKIELLAVGVEIKRDGEFLTDALRSVIVGQPINLTLSFGDFWGPLLPPVSAFAWTIGRSTVKDYSQSENVGTFTNLGTADLHAQSLGFYWIAADGGNVNAVATFNNGSKLYASETFTVARPTATLSSIPTVLVPAIDIRGGYMSFGEPAADQHVGIEWNASVTSTAGGAGEIAFTQLIKQNRSFTKSDGNVGTSTSNGSFVLDNKEGIQYAGTSSIGSGATVPHSKNDSPANFLAATVVHTGADDRFHTYLMYRPAGGIWVTLSKLDEWHWTGSATKTSGTWSMDAGQSSSGTLGSSDSTELPTWTGKQTALSITWDH